MSYRLRMTPGWKNIPLQMMQQGVARMATDIHAQAVRNAPIMHREDYTASQWRHAAPGALRNSGRFTRKGKLTWAVIFGGNGVDYAALRETTNRLHPETRFYLKRAGESAQARFASYFGRV